MQEENDRRLARIRLNKLNKEKEAQRQAELAGEDDPDTQAPAATEDEQAEQEERRRKRRRSSGGKKGGAKKVRTP